MGPNIPLILRNKYNHENRAARTGAASKNCIYTLPPSVVAMATRAHHGKAYKKGSEMNHLQVRDRWC